MYSLRCIANTLENSIFIFFFLHYCVIITLNQISSSAFLTSTYVYDILLQMLRHNIMYTSVSKWFRIYENDVYIYTRIYINSIARL